MKKSSSKKISNVGRGVLYTASGPVRRSSSPYASGPLPRTRVTRPRSQNPWLEDEPGYLPVDRRTFTPSTTNTSIPKSPPARRLNGVPARVVAPPPAKRAHKPIGQAVALYKPHTLLFQNPTGVGVCVQRGIRKEVLHAKNVAGKKGLAKPKRGPFSSVRCK